MIEVKLNYNSQGDLWHFTLYGHAEYADHGQDIVCAAVSMIVINTINSIDRLTQEPMSLSEDAGEGYIDCVFPDIQIDQGSREAILLLNSMVLGLKSVKKEYAKYIQINIHLGGE